MEQAPPYCPMLMWVLQAQMYLLEKPHTMMLMLMTCLPMMMIMLLLDHLSTRIIWFLALILMDFINCHRARTLVLKVSCYYCLCCWEVSWVEFIIFILFLQKVMASWESVFWMNVNCFLHKPGFLMPCNILVCSRRCARWLCLWWSVRVLSLFLSHSSKLALKLGLLKKSKHLRKFTIVPKSLYLVL